MRRAILSYVLICAALVAAWQCFAQVPMTGAGKATPTTAGCSTGGPGDCVSSAVAWWGFRGYTTAYSGKVANICTASDAACEDETASGGNLVLGTVGTACISSGTCLVKTLYDQSGALACAGGTACDVTQATASKQPTFTAAALNSVPCGTFAHSANQVLVSANSLSNSQPYTFSAIAERTANFTSQQNVVGTSVSNPIMGFWSTTNNAFVSVSTGITATASNSAFHSLQAVVNGASSSLVVDGTATSGDVGSGAIGQTVALGGYSNGGSSLTGIICEGGIWPSAFSSIQIANITNNQKTYWGL